MVISVDNSVGLEEVGEPGYRGSMVGGGKKSRGKSIKKIKFKNN